MSIWDGLEPRAVVPTKEMMDSENVIEASPEVARSSPYAFGLGISIMQPTIEGVNGTLEERFSS